MGKGVSMTIGTIAIVLAPALGLSACSRSPDQPGAISTDQDRQLNEAAEMLDANSIDANAFTTPDNESMPS